MAPSYSVISVSLPCVSLFVFFFFFKIFPHSFYLHVILDLFIWGWKLQCPNTHAVDGINHQDHQLSQSCTFQTLLAWCIIATWCTQQIFFFFLIYGEHQIRIIRISMSKQDRISYIYTLPQQRLFGQDSLTNKVSTNSTGEEFCWKSGLQVSALGSRQQSACNTSSLSSSSKSSAAC